MLLDVEYPSPETLVKMSVEKTSEHFLISTIDKETYVIFSIILYKYETMKMPTNHFCHLYY